MKIYLDNCCYNRPFDDQNQIKIHLEAQAKLYIQAQIREGIYDLVWSYILDYENGKNPYEERRLAIAPWKTIASFCILEETEEILLTAESLTSKGIKTYDALHISCAIAAHCEYYITTDKKLLNAQVTGIKIVSPIAFVNEMEG
ncbi:MAG: PIN domain-containing protein [bacterium]|nr:PIN domain-containing protein [bacterium]